MFKPALMIMSASALALAACGQKTSDTAVANDSPTFDAGNAGVADTNSTAMATPAAVTGNQAFVNMAAASDAFEITTSKLALDNGASAAVKKYANQMISAHTASTDKLKATTASLSPALTPDPTLSAAQQATVDSLKGLKGAAFDTAYIQAQQEAHQQTLDTLKGYAATGDVAALKTFATGLVPTVAAHLNMAKGLKA
ncbi:DUF4142 domain-containing protein [Sphingomonas kyungheensis]|uniref:DUF4142 domain-containing protein n=1 Tax=Sphingomonas kyungheensis TaxID=1069987 RepID=A0ABU8H0A4_9SPHN